MTDYEKSIQKDLNDDNRASAGHPREAQFAGVFLSELNRQPFNAETFALALCRDHPTVQQLFFKLLAQCIVTRSVCTTCSDERNEASVRFCKDLADLVKKYRFPMR